MAEPLARLDDFASFPFSGLCLLCALHNSQISLLAIWLGLGRTAGLWRLAGTLLAVAAWSYLMTGPIGLLRDWAVYPLVQAFAVGTPLLAARVCGLQLADGEAPLLGPGRFQFSILYLLGCTTALAVILSTLHYIARVWVPVLSIIRRPNEVVLPVGSAIMAIVGLWATLGTRWTAAGGSPWPTACVLVFGMQGMLLGVLLRIAPFRRCSPFCAFWRCSPVWSALSLVASLLVFRVAGYRLSWRSSFCAAQ